MVIYPSITKTSYTILFLLVNTLWINLSSAQSPFDVVEKSIVQLQQALASGETTSFELVELYLARIQAYDKQGPRLNSLIRQNRGAMQRARDLDAERAASGARGLLHGIPVIIKDNYNTDDMPTSGGSVALAGFVPNATATQVVKLRNAGAIILAKSNLHEYAYGITTISSLGGQTRNPYDLRRVPGGSSGGTAAAVAASFAAVGMGSDTCGSIRIPSAFNNLIGLRPSKGLSSIYGIMPLSHTQDVAGPLARSAVDLAIVLDAVAGFDSADAATSLMQNNQPLEFYAQLESMSLDGLRIAKLSSYFDAADSAMIAVIEQALQRFEQLGAEIIEVDIAGLSSLIARSGLIGHEFKTDLNQYLAHFGSTEIQDLATIVDKGLYHGAVRGALVRSQAGVVNQESYAAALLVREELRQAIEAVLEEQQIDVIVYPSIAQLQSFTGESQPGNNCSISANSGLPALAMPAGFTGSGLPVGL
ncbi:MAG: glutamyl-tRNA amidotransferase, partial [SAR86 cluster bacterium]